MKGQAQVSSLDRALSIVFVLIILATISALIYTVASVNTRDEFTEFYILGQNGKAEDYPKQILSGEEAWVILGIVNHEQEKVRYEIEIKINGVRNAGLKSLVLNHNEKWEEAVSFTSNMVADNQKVEFILFRDGESEPYLKPLQLWFDVKG
jgi:uncharacterized membrane protein